MVVGTEEIGFAGTEGLLGGLSQRGDFEGLIESG